MLQRLSLKVKIEWICARRSYKLRDQRGAFIMKSNRNECNEMKPGQRERATQLKLAYIQKCVYHMSAATIRDRPRPRSGYNLQHRHSDGCWRWEFWNVKKASDWWHQPITKMTVLLCTRLLPAYQNNHLITSVNLRTK